MIKIGERLQRARLEKGFTIEDVTKFTKIRPSFLEAIENGDFEKLPTFAYARGFIRNYAKFLGLPEKETLALFRREYDSQTVFKILPQGFEKSSEFEPLAIRTKRTIIITAFFFFVLLLFILFQYRSAIFNPQVDVSSPQENEVIKASSITVSGKTDPNAAVFINNYPASLDLNGKFTKIISVFPGKTAIIIRVKNSFGRETVVKRDVEIKPSP